MSALQIDARDNDGRARTGVLRTAHGDVRTPAFVPLATKATVRGMTGPEVAALGYDMVLGNTYHLFLTPGHELIARFGGLHEFMKWDAPIITDSGGFQVFSMGHGTVADEIKGRSRPSDRAGRLLSIDEEGARFRSYIDGSEHFLAPETSMEIQAALGSDIALAFDECTPLNVDREYTARSTRAHASVAAAVPGLARRARAGRAAAVRDRAGRGVRGHARGVGRGGDGERLPRDRDRRLAGGRQAADARGRRLGDRGAAATTNARATCSGSATSTT